ncbi:hypothetical protein KXV94_007017 [Aspergillus fumigatus]|nr:hypothetical protein KXV94_007017 [Aspergillus fumigatus]
MTKVNIIFALFNLIPAILVICSTQSPFYPPPSYNRQSSEVWEALGLVEASLSNLLRNSNNLNTSSYSIEITPSRSTLWSTFHTAKDKNLTRPGADRVDETSRYRIASITKVFTVLGILQQHAAGNLSLEDMVDKYIPQLRSSHHDGTRSSGSIQWDKISLRSLVSQLSGLPRDWVQGDFLTDPESVNTTTKCDSDNSYRPCTAEDLFDNLRRRRALFALNTKSTYSNLAFDLLGLVLTNVTGTTFEEYITASILDPLGMAHHLSNHRTAVENPTGGLYSSTHDMSILLRYILSNYKDIADAKLNWLLPVSFTAGMGSYYGMPWEIFRADRILLPDDKRRARTVTFFTKDGGVPRYRSIILIVPEYDLGITVLTAGDETLLEVIVDMVIVPLIRAADALAARQVKETYMGRYTSSPTKEQTVNSTLTLTYTSTHGLEINEWISKFHRCARLHIQALSVPRNHKVSRSVDPLWSLQR